MSWRMGWHLSPLLEEKNATGICLNVHLIMVVPKQLLYIGFSLAIFLWSFWKPSSSTVLMYFLLQKSLWNLLQNGTLPLESSYSQDKLDVQFCSSAMLTKNCPISWPLLRSGRWELSRAQHSSSSALFNDTEPDLVQSLAAGCIIIEKCNFIPSTE